MRKTNKIFSYYISDQIFNEYKYGLTDINMAYYGFNNRTTNFFYYILYRGMLKKAFMPTRIYQMFLIESLGIPLRRI